MTKRATIAASCMLASQGVTAFAGPGAPEPAQPTTPAEIAAQIQQALHDFQTANDERLTAIESGMADGLNRDTVETINARITELQNLAEQQAAAIARGAVMDAANDPATIRSHAARFFTAASFFGGNRGRIVRPDAAGLDVAQYRDYRTAFDDLLRAEANIDALGPDVRNALQVGSDPAGGYLVPGEMSAEMEQRIHDTSPMRQYARVITVGGSYWEAPYKSSKGTSGGWVGERQSRPATGTPTVGMQRIDAQEQYAYPEVTSNMLADGMIDIEGFVVDETEDEMTRTENLAFVSGDGVLKPRGFLDYGGAAVTTADASRDWGKLQYVASGAAGAFPKWSGGASDDGAALIDLLTALHPGYRDGAIWAMNRNTEAEVRKLRDADGRYLVGFGDLGDGATGFSVHGYPIANFEDMPNVAANSFSIAFGNFRRGYFIIDRSGFQLIRDPYTNKPYVGFYISKRTGGDVRNFDAIKLMKFAAS